jgi:glycosyltransferase involved in cell wall biosynthesis
MKLLFVTPYFPPTAGSGVPRGAKFVKYLLRMGWKVRVVTIDPVAYPDRDEELAREVAGVQVDTVELSRLPGVEHTVLRAMPGLRAAISHAMREFRPDVVLATTPDYHWTVVAEEATRRRVPFVLDYPDPWTVLPEGFRAFGDLPKARSRLKWAMAPQIERRLLSAAAFATFATEPIQREYVLARYLGAARAHVLENGFDEEDFEVAAAKPPSDVIRVSHVGSFAGRRSPVSAARAVAWAGKQREGFELSLVGAGTEPWVQELEAVLGPTPLRLIGWVPHPVAIQEMRAASVLWLDAGVELRSASTGKIYEYLRSGRPICAVAHPKSPAAELIRRFDAGTVVSSEEPAEAGAALVDLASRLPRPRDPEELEYYSREALAARLSTLLQGVTK